MSLPDDPSPYLAAFGRLHVLVLHLPIGLLPGAALLEFGAPLLRRPVPKGAVLALVALTAVAGAVATASGLVLAAEQSSSALLGRHKNFGIALGVACLLLPVLALLRPRLPFRLLLLLALALAVPVGHFGGSITHGSDFLWQPFRRAGERPLAASVPTVPTVPPPLDPFTRDVLPVLERTCVSCHNPDKLKGELLLTTFDGVMQGGENGVVVVPGEPDRSELLARCLLPLDDDDHMPPDGKPQPTEAELQVLRAWIEAGAAGPRGAAPDAPAKGG